LGHEEAVPEDGYLGPYMIELGADLAREFGGRFWEMPREEALPAIGKLGLERIIAVIRADLALMGIHYDVWFSEQTLYSTASSTG
jgi:arginyl-tRNA synthetase